MKAIIEYNEKPHGPGGREIITDLMGIVEMEGVTPYVRFATKHYQAVFPWRIIKRLEVVNDEKSK